jgi:hypothetical protein
MTVFVLKGKTRFTVPMKYESSKVRIEVEAEHSIDVFVTSKEHAPMIDSIETARNSSLVQTFITNPYLNQEVRLNLMTTLTGEWALVFGNPQPKDTAVFFRVYKLDGY